MQFDLDLDTQLNGDFDAERRFARFTPDRTVKGMFFPRLLAMVGTGPGAATLKLTAPPRLGRYLPFSDYPQVDYSRIAHAAATRRFSTLSVSEAARRIARDDFAQFGSSAAGRISLSLIGDARSALLKLPDLMRMVLKGGRVEATSVDDRAVRVQYRDFLGWTDCYSIGTVEGIVMHYGHRPSVDVTLLSDVDADYVVRW